MNNKVGRNDPCPCGSGKKYKNCHLPQERKPTGPKKFSAKVITSQPKGPIPVNLIERNYGAAIDAANKEFIQHPQDPPKAE